MSIIIGREGGEFSRTRRLGPARFERLVRAEVGRRGKAKRCLRILRRLCAALSLPAEVLAHRPGAFERIGWLIEDWDTARDKLLRTEQRMVAVLNELGLTDLVCSIKGLSAVGPAAILAETGDLPRFHQRPSRGNARRTRPAGTDVGHLHWTCPPDRRRPAWAADRGLAGRVGRATRQPHVRGPAIGT